MKKLDFIKNFFEIREEKNSNLCIGIDPAVEGMRKKNVVFIKYNPPRDILEFSLDIVSKTSDYALAFKPNLQYILPLELKEMRELNDFIHEKGSLSILDVKLSDIGSTNKACCYWASRCGFDAITASPFPGNMDETQNMCRENGIGLFVLCLMSNPQASLFMKSRVGSVLAYEHVAKKIEEFGVTGAVVGATIAYEDAKKLSDILKNALVLIPGIGAQGGDTSLIKIFGKRSLVNVSRAIIFSEDPQKKARYYRDLINQTLI
ncbi:MAG: orotidine-5'-phosphate decarboxylase [Candidatus Methanofastidiosia archaeon]